MKEFLHPASLSDRALRLGLLFEVCLDRGVKPVSLDKISKYCDEILKIKEIDDWSSALNGLQVSNRRGITRIAAAVDASLVTVQMAERLGADLLVVHHGLFWSAKHPWIGRNYDLIEKLVQSGMAVYSAHLPLDVHPRMGNNVLLAKSLGFRQLQPFFFDRGRHLGVKAKVRLKRDSLVEKLEAVLGGPPTLLPGGEDRCCTVGIVTGGAGAEMNIAASEGVDTFITGEGPHWTYAMAEDLGINVLYGGHYATETFGVKALTAHLSKRFKIPWSFVDHPTGL